MKRGTAMIRTVICLGLILSFAVAALGQSPSVLVEVTGSVVDVNGEAVAKAKVILRRMDGAKEQITTTDAVGAFHFARVAPGSCEIEVQKEAFKPEVIQLSVGARTPAPLCVVLSVADLREDV